MRKMTALFALSLAILLLFSFQNNTAYAQQEERHVFVVQTWKTVMPEHGSAAERDSLLAEFFEAVPMKNDKILSEKNLRHYIGGNSQDWVIILEFKSWEDFAVSQKINQELFNEKWPDEKERAEFNRKLGKYFPSHSDEIYRELPKFRK